MRGLLDRIDDPRVTKILVYCVFGAGLLGMSVFSVKVGNYHLFPYRILIPLIWLISIIRLIRNRGQLEIQPIKIKVFGLFLLVWFLYAVISFNWAIDKTGAIRHIFFLALSFSLILFSVLFFDTIDDLYIVSIIWLGFLSLMLILGFFESTYGYHLPVSRYYQSQRLKLFPTGVFYNENDFATYLSLSAPFLLSYFLFAKKFLYRFLLLGSFLALLYVMVSTDSRANFIAIILEIGFFVVIFFSFQSNRKEILFLITSSILVLLFFPERVLNRAERLLRNFQTLVVQLSTQTESIGHRINLAKNGLLFLLSTWGFGVGAGNVEYWMQTRAYYEIGYRINIHNWFLEVLVNYGIFIFAGYMIFYFSLIYKIFQVLKRNQNDHKMKLIGVAILGSMIGFLAASISSSSIIAFKPQWMMYAIGLTYVNIGLNKSEEEGQY